jgi:CheY-like chemotaxis protein
MTDTATKRWDVVLAEDDQEDVMIFELAIAEAKLLIHLRHAANGDDLFTLLQQALPEILFLDIHMPCKDGISCILEIRRNPAYNKLPVVMYTSYKTKEKINQAFEAGANLYLLKTNTIMELAEYLKSIFSIEWKKYLLFPNFDRFTLGNE